MTFNLSLCRLIVVPGGNWCALVSQRPHGNFLFPASWLLFKYLFIHNLAPRLSTGDDQAHSPTPYTPRLSVSNSGGKRLRGQEYATMSELSVAS